MRLDRRALLASGAALALAGCGREPQEEEQEAVPGSETSRRGDRELLDQLVEWKLRAVAEYASPHAPEGFRAIEEAQLRRLTAVRRGTADVSAEIQSGSASRRRLADLERTSIALILDVLPKLADPHLRSLVASMLPVEAQQLAVLSGERAPFVYGERVL